MIEPTNQQHLVLPLDAQGSPQVAHIYNGTAPQLPERCGYNKHIFNLVSLTSYIESRVQSGVVKPVEAVVHISRSPLKEEMARVNFNSNECMTGGVNIIAMIEVSDELKKFNINSNKYYGLQEMIKLLRFNRRYFADPNQCVSLILQLQNFNAKVNKQFTETTEKRNSGIKASAFSQETTMQINTRIDLCVSLFEGYEPVTIPVELCYDEIGGSIQFWLESVELPEIQSTYLEEKLADFILSVKDLNIPVLM